ncbi:MAG TPA: enoyl-[acyl-carrier-protein] reductase FabK [Dehalococcoidia bacterium]|nr:enoyl-[acyl-carrier-protein] reductase FabK [Dehalococcoidia bacterium]
MLKTVVCDLFNIRYPILQGGMAHIGTYELVSAVSNAGGLGIIGSGFYEPEWLRNQIHMTKQYTNCPFGVNIQMASPHVRQVADVVIEEGVAFVTTGAGNPRSFVAEFKRAGIKVVPVVNSPSAAKHMEKAGVDAVIAEGTESGGHVGETTTMVLVPEVVDSVKIPVIAAGGICDGRGMAAVMALGASGIQMGTRFACSKECIAHQNYKRRIMEAAIPATVVTRQVLGYPQRSLKNELTDRFIELEKAGVPNEELEMFDRGRMYLGLIEGDIQEGTLLAGQIAGRIKEEKSVKDIIEETISEAEMVISSLKKLITED